MKAKILSLALAAAGLTAGGFALYSLGPAEAVAASPSHVYTVESSAAPDPARHVLDLVRHFRNDDVRALAQTLVPPEAWEEALIKYEVERQQPSSEAERARFAAEWERMTSPDAVERIMAEAEPKLAEARAQLPGALLMGFMGLQMAMESPDSGLTELQRRNLKAVLPGVQQWTSTVDFLSADRLRHALTLVTDSLRDTGLEDLEAIKALPMEAIVDRFGPVLAAGKAAVREYGIDLDSIADSLQVEVLEMEEDVARIRTTITVFGGQISGDHSLILVDGRWYPGELGTHFRAHRFHFSSR